jgi:hypothetical protein
MNQQSNDTTSCLTPEEQDKLGRIAEGVVRSLQKLDDLTSGTDVLLKSGVSKCCSANSNGCEINSQTIATPPPARPAG